RSLEWTIQSPTPAHNFDVDPVVTQLDDFWHRKYQEDENGRLVRVAESADIVQPGNPEGVHLPSPSYWPLVIATGLPFVGWGLIYSLWLCAVGGILVVAGIYGWILEPSTAPGVDHGHHDEPTPSGSDDAGTSATGDAETGASTGASASGTPGDDAGSDEEAALVD
ncbi:MAG: cytochrome c oxidase subunit 4, partial [Acidimicrobiia bacterium]|nr:cytochrome c oxidase subunit 4 [Acidimicrobiia bacterium]